MTAFQGWVIVEVVCKRCNEHVARLYTTPDGLVLHVGLPGAKSDVVNIDRFQRRGVIPVRCTRDGPRRLTVADLKAAAARPRSKAGAAVRLRLTHPPAVHSRRLK
jgi:hypothetical protein